jgi:hypothetical protein
MRLSQLTHRERAGYLELRFGRAFGTQRVVRECDLLFLSPSYLAPTPPGCLPPYPPSSVPAFVSHCVVHTHVCWHAQVRVCMCVRVGRGVGVRCQGR